jgi:hypothetical protein
MGRFCCEVAADIVISRNNGRSGRTFNGSAIALLLGLLDAYSHGFSFHLFRSIPIEQLSRTRGLKLSQYLREC